MASSWADFLAKVENPSPGDAVLTEVIKFFTDTLKVPNPELAEGYTEEQVSSVLPAELPVQACVRRVLRAVNVVAQAKRAAQVNDAVTAGGVPGASAHGLARLLAPGKTADVASLLKKAGMEGLSFGLQAEQVLWNSMQQHTEECKVATRTPFLFIDLTSKEMLPMWLTPDVIGGKFQLHDDGDWPLRAHAPIASLQDLGKALKSATASPRFFRTVSQWSGAFLRYAVVAVATEQLSWQTVLAHMDIVLQLAEQERMKGNRPFLAFLYEELLRKSWARRAGKGDPGLNIAKEAMTVDKDLLDIARHRMTEVLKEAGLTCAVEDPPIASASQARGLADPLVSRQLAAAEAAQKQAEKATKQLAEAQQQILKQSRAMADTERAVPNGESAVSKKALKTQKWLAKMKQRRQEQQQRKEQKQRQGQQY